MLGYWPTRVANSSHEQVRDRYRLDRIPSMLLRAEGIELVTAAGIARMLGVAEARVNQLAASGRLSFLSRRPCQVARATGSGP